MKIKNKIFFISIAIVLFLLSGYYYYKYRQVAIEQMAKEAFVEAVNDEAYKRIPDVKLTVGINGGKLLKKDEAPKYIYWYDELGKRKYEIDSEKHWKNVTMDSDVRIIHSCAFKDYPLNPDSLNYNWQNYLKKKNLVCRTGIYMFLIDWDEETTSLLTSDSEWWQNLQPFWVRTIGYRCEMECQLYLQYSLWQVLGFVGIGYILLYIFLIFTLYKITSIIRRKMNPEKIITEKEVLVNEVLVKEVEATTVRLYHLGGDVYFDAEKRIISEGEKNVSLTNQSAELLELFLQADNHVLSVNAIGLALWNADGNYDNRIYQALNRLRGFLKQFPSLSIENVSVGEYRLRISKI